MIRKIRVFILTACFLVFSAAEAQTLESITITGFIPTGTSTSEQLKTGASVTLTAIGTFSDGTNHPVLATWSSSKSSLVSVDSTTGTVTGLAGTITPVTITASSGTVISTVTFTVVPQTAIYAVDGNDNLYIYDNTQVVINGLQKNALPSLVTSLQYENTKKGANSGDIVPMALSPDQRYLFIANPASTSSSTGDFIITVIDTQNNYTAVETVSTGSGTNILTDANLCYPTSLAIGSNLEQNNSGQPVTTSFLFVVNAGTSAALGTAASCSSESRGGNVQVFLINEGTSQVLQLYDTITSADLANATIHPIANGNYVPLLAAASSDQQDESVYIAWTDNYASTGTGPGIITPISLNTDTTNLNGSTNPNYACGLYPSPPPSSGNAVCQVIPLSSGTTTNGFNISPLTLAVATTYPSWNGGPAHTVLYTGPGYNTTLSTPDLNYPSWGYFSDSCDTSIKASCLTYTPSSPQTIYPGAPAGPPTYTAAASTTSPSGYVYALDQTYYLEYFDPFASPDPTTGQPIYGLNGFTTTAGNFNNCTAEGCLPLLAITSRSDDSSLYLTTTGSGFYAVSPTPLSGALLQVNTSAPSLLGLLMSQAPEVQLFLNQSGQNILGENSSTYFTVKGNFQNQISGTTYALSCAWGAGQPTWSADQSISSATGGTVYPQLVPSYTSSIFNARVTPAVTDANQTNGSIITGISVGPVTSVILAATPTVPLGGQDQLTSVVSNAASDGAIASWYINGATCVPGGTNSCPFGYVDSNGVYNAPSVVSSSPMTVQICALPSAINSSSPGYGNSPCANTTVSYTANSMTVTAGSPYSNTITLNVVTPIATLSSTSLAFTAPQTVGTTSGAQIVTLTNSGQAALVLAATPLAITGTNASDFTVASGTTCTASLSLAPASSDGTGGGSCVIAVTFAPSASGQRTATLQITDNSGGTPGTIQAVSLSGTGQAPTTPTATLSTLSLTFTAPQTVGTTSGAQIVTLTNTGQAALILSAIPLAITGTNASDFATVSGTTCTANQSLAPTSGACSINITFTPTAVGSRTATLQITDNSGGTAGTTQMVTLSGTGQSPGAPKAALSTSLLTFSAQNTGTTSPAQSITLTDTGQVALVLSATPLTITGTNASDFAIASGTTCAANQSVAPTSGTCLVNISFAPSAVGSRTATLQITDNSGGAAGTTQMVTLIGTGQSPIVLSIYPSSPALEPGGSQPFTPLFQPTSASGTVSWSVTGSGCNGKPCGGITTNGTYTAPSSLSASAVDTVTVTLVANQTVSGSTQVTLFLRPAVTSGPSEAIAAGQSATFQLNLAGGTGDSKSPLTVECYQETLPTGVSCQPVAVQPGATSTTFSLVVQTTGNQTAETFPDGKSVLASIVLVFPLWLLPLIRNNRFASPRERANLVIFLVSTTLCLLIGSCGTGGSFGQSAPKSFGGTPSGTYSIQLAGVEPNGTTDSNIGTVTLVVQ